MTDQPYPFKGMKPIEWTDEQPDRPGGEVVDSPSIVALAQRVVAKHDDVHRKDDALSRLSLAQAMGSLANAVGGIDPETLSRPSPGPVVSAFKLAQKIHRLRRRDGTPVTRQFSDAEIIADAILTAIGGSEE